MEVLMDQKESVVIVFTSDGMGRTDDQSLRERLANTFLRLLDEGGVLPGAICFYTEGVRLACDGSPILDELKKLEAQGVHLILCSTCLNAYGLQDQVRVGIIGGMADIIEAMQRADKVISL